MKRIDRYDNIIGDGSIHELYDIYEFPEHPEISHTINKSATTESVYVTYSNSKLHKGVTVRFSTHTCNAVEFGDMLNGKITSRDEILFHLGLKARKFIPETYLFIYSRQIKKRDLPLYEESPLTIQEMYALGENADLTPYVGKVAKGSNYLILGEKVSKVEKTGVNRIGQKITFGDYKYFDL